MNSIFLIPGIGSFGSGGLILTGPLISPNGITIVANQAEIVPNTNNIIYRASGIYGMYQTDDNLRFEKDMQVGFNSSDTAYGSGLDIYFTRIAAGVLGLLNDSTHGVGLRVTTDGLLEVRNRANSAFGILTAEEIRSNSGDFVFSGKGAVRGVSDAFINLLNAAGNAGVGLRFSTDNLLEIRTRTNAAYASLRILGLGIDGAGPFTGGIGLSEIVSPSAPSSNEGRLFIKDNGSGKTQLVVIFSSGAEQVIATEP